MNTYGGDPNSAEPYSSFWQYIDLLRTRSTMFQNFFYSETESAVSASIHSFIVNCMWDVWLPPPRAVVAL